mgnify:FL=1
MHGERAYYHENLKHLDAIVSVAKVKSLPVQGHGPVKIRIDDLIVMIPMVFVRGISHSDILGFDLFHNLKLLMIMALSW